MLGHNLEVLRLDAQGAQVLGDAQVLAKGLQGIDAGFAGLEGRHALNVDVHGLSDDSEPLQVADQVELLDIGQQDGVADAVGQVIEAAQLVGHGVDVTKGSVVEGNASQILGVSHFGTGLHIVAVGHGLGQVVNDLVNGLDGSRVGQGVGGSGDIGLDRVGQRVHTGGCGQGGRHADHQLRVIDGDGGGDSPVHDAHLDFTGGVGDDAEPGDLGGGAGGGVHGHQGGQGLVGLVHALIIGDLAAVGRDQTDALGAVVGGAAAQGQDTVTFVFMVELLTLDHVGVLGVRLRLAKDGGLHPGVGQDLLDAGSHGVCGQEGVGHDHGLGAADALNEVPGLLDGAFSEHVSAGYEIIGRHTLFLSFLTRGHRASHGGGPLVRAGGYGEGGGAWPLRPLHTFSKAASDYFSG